MDSFGYQNTGFNSAQYYVQPTITSANTYSVNFQNSPQVVQIGGRLWDWHPELDLYLLQTDSQVRITQEQANQIINGEAAIDWATMRIQYLDRARQQFGSGTFSWESVKADDTRTERDWLDAQVAEVCKQAWAA